MAKIINVELISIPEFIEINNDKTDFTVVIDLEFHKLDIELKMEYYLYCFIYDTNGKVDNPLILSNWDDSKVLQILKDRKNDDYLGFEKIIITSNEDKKTITIPMKLILGNVNSNTSFYSKTIKAFSSLIPAIGIASKWSKSHSSTIEY